MANRRFIDFPVATTVGAGDIILIWQDGLNKQTTKATILSGLPEDLEDLADVDISGLTNGQILRYNSTTGKWENTDQGNLDLADLNDVSIVSPANGQVLVYNSGTGKWENSSAGFVPYTGAVTTVNLGVQQIIAGSFAKTGGTAAQFLKADGSVDSTAYGTGSVTSVGLTMPTAFTVANSPVTGAGTIGVTGAGTTADYIRGDGSLATFPGLTGFVPYTGANQTVNLNTQQLQAGHTTVTTNGSGETLTVNHTSGSGIGLNITKGGNNEGLRVNKTSGSGNAATIIGTLEATTLVKTGGTAAQFLKADGTVDSSVYALNSALASYQLLSAKGQPNGYAGLDGNGKVPLAQINDALLGNVNFQGLWNAATNTPTLANPPAAGTKGHYYIVSTAGTFAGISFDIGDWIISSGTTWDKVDNTDAVSSVFGRTGNISATSGDYNTSQVTENTNLYFTNARAIASVLTGYTSGAGVISAADSILAAIQKLNGNIGALTTGVSSVNGQTGVVTLTTTNIAEGTNLYYTEARVNANTNVAANTAARHAAVTLGTANGLSLATQQLSLGLASAGVTGALSATDWSTFNSKQNALTNPVTGIGTTNFLPKFTGASTIGNSDLENETNGNLILGNILNTTLAKFLILKIGGSSDFANNTTLFLAATNESTTANLIRFNGAIAKGLVFGRGIGVDNFVWGFTDSTTPVMTLTSSGNLGINNPNPGSKLGIIVPNQGTNFSALDITNTLNASFNVSLRTDFTTITAGGTGNLVFANASERLRITSDGTIGFNGSSNVGNAGLDKMSMGYLNSNYGWIQTFGGTRLLLNPSGNNVVIGDLSSDNGARLQVSGTTSFTGISTFNNGTNSTNGIKIISNLSASVFTGGIEFIRETVVAGSKIEPFRNSVFGGVGIKFLVTANNAAEISGSYTSALEILSTQEAIFSSSVGIGVSPSYPLTISAVTANTAFYNTFNNAANRNWAIAFGIGSLGDFNIMSSNAQNGDPISAGTSRFNIQANGNIGIGTSTPGEQLTLSRATYPTIKLIDTTDSASGYFQYHSEANEFRLLTISSHPLIFSTTDTERMRITSDGTIGFNGNTNIGDAGLGKMSMGYLNSNYGWIQTWSGTRLLINPSGNNVLIGKTADTGQRLQVNGDVYTQKESGNTSFFMKRVVTDTNFEISVQEIQTRIRTWSSANDRDMLFDTDAAGTTRMVIKAGGNVLIGTTTDNGQRLQVAGDVRISQNVGIATNSISQTRLTINGENNSSVAFGLVVRNSSSTNLFSVSNSGTVLIGGTTDTGARLQVSGGDIGIQQGHGLRLVAPNGVQYRVTINNSGTLVTTAI